MFDRFNDNARRILLVAQESAREMSHGHIGPEHLLYALLVTEGGPQRTLLAAGLDPSETRQAVDDIAGGGGRGFSGPHLPFSALAKRALEMSLREAIALGSSALTPEHLLLGLIADADGPAARMVISAGSTVDAVRSDVLQSLTDEREDEHPAGRGRVFAGPRGERGANQLLEQLGVNLTQLARDGRLDPMIGRGEEIERVVQILARRTKNNPILIGEPGVGKTAVVEGLAQRIASGDVPAILKNSEIFSLDMGSVLAGTRYRGDFEERFKKVLAELSRNKNTILFIDELHTLVGAGAGVEGGTDAVSLLKPLLARGEVRLVGATTLSEYRKVEADKALARRLQTITVGEPSAEVTVAILNGLRARYEEHHGVEITDAAVDAAVRLSARYITDRRLPDKAIDLLDEAAARLQVRPEEGSVVDVANVAQVLSVSTGIPVTMLTSDESQRLVGLESSLARRVIGQEGAVTSLARAVRRSRAGLSDPNRPSGSFIFAGPSGVGKTELAKTLAQEVFGGEQNLIAVDMSEYGEKHAVSRLFGAPPGYVGYDQAGQLTEQVRRRPYSVVLFDEIEKAHPEVLDVLLQLLEEGRLTDGQGKIVDFRNTVVVLTTNLGSSDIGKSLGFETGATGTRFAAKINAAVKAHLRPELLNRVDEVIVFEPLSAEATLSILDIFVAKVAKRLEERGIGLHLSDRAKEWLVSKGVDAQLGARPMRRTVQRELEDRLSELILTDDLTAGATALVDVNPETGLTFTVVPAVEAVDVGVD
jgi:ATP-dependent Clp protease ATP-binding subunit ClpC